MRTFDDVATTAPSLALLSGAGRRHPHLPLRRLQDPVGQGNRPGGGFPLHPL